MTKNESKIYRYKLYFHLSPPSLPRRWQHSFSTRPLVDSPFPTKLSSSSNGTSMLATSFLKQTYALTGSSFVFARNSGLVHLKMASHSSSWTLPVPTFHSLSSLSMTAWNRSPSTPTQRPVPHMQRPSTQPVPFWLVAT